MTGGFFGEMLTALAFSGAAVSVYALFQAGRGPLPARRAWELLGRIAFGVHGFSILGVMATLFYLIYTHQYQYYYVWNHSSNELPVYYMISCFWEGQEGSFLLWAVWHVVLGGVIALRPGAWSNGVLGTIMLINLVLTTMILGVHIPESAVHGLLALALLVPGALLARRMVQDRAQTLAWGHALGGIVVLLLALLVLLLGQGGAYSLPETPESVSYPLAVVLGVALLVYAVFTLFVAIYPVFRASAPVPTATQLFAAFILMATSWSLLYYAPAEWMLGSSPFVLHRDVMSQLPVYAINSAYIPTNGAGLNPLLQNYWMVIHPPTLFLGFASTTIPFGYVITALMRRDYKGWISPALPWMIFTGLTLGVGIIMGGYWAYETLNFGGYWNWDPVENSSLVPWLLAITAIHAVLAYRRSGGFLNYAMLMNMAVFLLVLYSTFLTRSGILGESSVHSFTDLGLSGQLLVLLFLFVFAVAALYLNRLREIPAGRKDVALNSPEFFIFLGTLVLLFSGIVITVFTSIPVFNVILGTAWSPPKDTAFLYFRWTVWFAVGFGVLSAMAQYLFWRRMLKKPVRAAMARPFVTAMIAASVIIILLKLTGERFTLDSRLLEWQELASMSSSVVTKAARYIYWFVFTIADEFLLFSALFTIFANLDILIALLRRKISALRVTGGSVAHIGFGLMLTGVFFSSGYDSVVSKNVNPGELPNFSASEQADNVVLLKNQPREIVGYQVTYLGKKEAQAPVSDLQIIEDDGEGFKVSFLDATGDLFAFLMPRDVFLDESGKIDLNTVKEFLDDKVEFIKPEHINNRTLYTLRFVPHVIGADGQPQLLEDQAFILYPEAELNENMGLLAHPSRRVNLSRDLYVHVSGVFDDSKEEPEFKSYDFQVGVGETFQTGRARVVFEKISADSVQGTKYELIARAHLRVTTDIGHTVEVTPVYRIDKEGNVSMRDAWLDEISSFFAFYGVDPVAGKIRLHVEEEINPMPDSIVLKALSKPWINLLWLGTFVLTAGFGLAMYRRISEHRAKKGSATAHES